MHHSVVHPLATSLAMRLDTVVQLGDKANAQDEAVLLAFGPIEDEVVAPYQRSRQVTEPVPDLREGQLKILHQVSCRRPQCTSAWCREEEGCQLQPTLDEQGTLSVFPNRPIRGSA